MHLLTATSNSATSDRPARRLADVKTVGAILGLSERTVYRHADRGIIPAGIKLGAARRWDLTEIDDFIRDGAKPSKGHRKGAKS